MREIALKNSFGAGNWMVVTLVFFLFRSGNDNAVGKIERLFFLSSRVKPWPDPHFPPRGREE